MTFNAVVTTGIYCRDGCGGRPHPHNVRQFEFAAGAEAAGFRACLRCRPYRSSEPARIAGDADLVCRAIQLVLDGSLDGRTEESLGSRLGVSARHLRRLFVQHVGATPDQLARSRRSHFARRLLDDTDLPFATVAYASGFGSVRQFNRAMSDVFGSTPRELRAHRRRSDRLVADGGLALRLPFHRPLDWDALVGFFAARTITGVETVEGDVYRRTVMIDGDPGVIEVGPGAEDVLIARLHLPHWNGLIHHVQRMRRMFDLDTEPRAVASVLRSEAALRPLIDARPGLRVPGVWDPFELVVRAIIGQQISVAGARTIAGRIVARLGRPVPGLAELGLSHTFPDVRTIADGDLDGLGMPGARVDAIRAAARAVAGGELVLDGSLPRDELTSSLKRLPGIGEWTASYIALRLGHADAFPASDLGLRKAIASNGSLPAASEIAARAERWRPWRAYAAVALWTSPPR